MKVSKSLDEFRLGLKRFKYSFGTKPAKVPKEPPPKFGYIDEKKKENVNSFWMKLFLSFNFFFFCFGQRGVIKILNPLLFTNSILYLGCNKLNFKYGVQSINLVISYYYSFSSNQYIISIYFTFISCALSMGTWERGNFLVKTQLMTNPWEILLIVGEGNQKNTNVREFFGKKFFLLQWKRKSKIEWSKEVEITKQSLNLSKGSASDLLRHNWWFM